MFDKIVLETTSEMDADELSRFYDRLHHKPSHSSENLKRMIERTFCFVTARCDGELIGMARGVTDGLSGRLAECKLDPGYQGPACVTKTDGRIEHDTDGIAEEMARRVIDALRAFGVERVDVIAYGTEVDFCKDLGFRAVRSVVCMELPAGACVTADSTVTTAAAYSR